MTSLMAARAYISTTNEKSLNVSQKTLNGPTPTIKDDDANINSAFLPTLTTFIAGIMNNVHCPFHRQLAPLAAATLGDETSCKEMKAIDSSDTSAILELRLTLVDGSQVDSPHSVQHLVTSAIANILSTNYPYIFCSKCRQQLNLNLDPQPES